MKTTACIHPCRKTYMPAVPPNMVLCGLCGAPVVDLVEFQREAGLSFAERFTAYLAALKAGSEQSAREFFDMAGETAR